MSLHTMPTPSPLASVTNESHVSLATAADARDWDGFVEGHTDGTVEHLWAWRDVFEQVFRQRSSYLVARRDGRVSGILPLVLIRSLFFGRTAVSLPFFNYAGIVATDRATSKGLLDAGERLAREFGAKYLELRHRTRRFAELPVRENKVGLALDLPSNTDLLWKTVDRKVRNQIRKAQKDGLVTTSGDASLLTDFYSVFAQNMRDLGTPVFPKALFEQTFRQFAGRSRVFLVHHGEHCIAAGIALRFRDMVLVPWASSLREFRPLCGNMLLYWSMLEWSLQEGACTFDFGRSSTGSGTHAFKLQWGAAERALHTEYLLLKGGDPPATGTDNPRMKYAIDAWRRLPLGLANTLGPPIIRHLS